METIVKMKFGSHLYGTATENSDFDFKGIFLPSMEDIFLNKIPKETNESTNRDNNRKNSAGDIDCEYYSLHYFIKLACEGQTVAIDMLHAPEDMILCNSEIWKEIQINRHRFYTRNLQAFVGYARRQASKYGIKGSRLSAARVFIDLLSDKDDGDRLETVWDDLPTGEHMGFIEDSTNGVRQYKICGKIVQERQKIGYTLDILKKFYNAYGQRAKDAANNKNIDWKAVSHAIRAALQVKDILTKGTITFPLKYSDLLLNIKLGALDYLSEVAPYLEHLMDEVDVLSEKSDLPEKVDRKYWDDFIIRVITNHVL